VHLLVTAGPTREYIDDVRFLSNPSTGKMGFACAESAARKGHRVTLVTGPTGLPDPKGVRTVRVVSAREMLRAAKEAYPEVDAVIATAAVSDYRPARRARGKRKKGEKEISLPLVRNPDILATLGRKKGNRVLIGFALEVRNARANALKKCREKNLDWIVLNGPSSLGAEKMNAAIYREGRLEKKFTNAAKRRVADWLIRLL
jgi:phosphopantothenoylcysteine decarboxylase/phosphopantothenate--cysteine ligase